LLFQLSSSLTPQPVQLTHRQHHVAGQIVFQLAQLERRAAESPELFAQTFRGQRLLLGLHKHHI